VEYSHRHRVGYVVDQQQFGVGYRERLEYRLKRVQHRRLDHGPERQQQHGLAFEPASR
jgi:hypothetical protein